MITLESFGRPPDEPESPFARASVGATYRPSLGEVTGAFAQESLFGTGSLSADFSAADIRSSEQLGSPITEDEWKASDSYRNGLKHYPSMTAGSAKILAEEKDDEDYRGFVISRASGAQKAAGYAAAFGAGMFEPKNLGVGVATSLIGGFVAQRAIGAARIARMAQKYGRYAPTAFRGAAEGVVGAGITEPFNRESAKVLQRDYTAADTLWNLGLSAVFGAGFNVAGERFFPTAVPDSAAKPGGVPAEGIDMPSASSRPDIPYRTDEAVDLLDAATTQLAEGRKIDMSASDYVLKVRPDLEAYVFAKQGLLPEDVLTARMEALQARLDVTREKLSAFDAGAAAERNLRESGYPVDVMAGMAQRVEEIRAGRAAARDAIDPGKRGKRLRQYDEETDRIVGEAEDELRSVRALNDEGRVGEANRAAREEGRALEREIRRYQKRIDKYKAETDRYRMSREAVGEYDALSEGRGIGPQEIPSARGAAGGLLEPSELLAATVRANVDNANTTAATIDDVRAVDAATERAKTDPEGAREIADLERETAALEESGLLDAQDLAALDSLKEGDNPDDYYAALDAAKLCLTGL